VKHSIILWDCCYRNFFHLTGSLAAQDFPRDEYEIIWVEQRSREESDAFNQQLGLLSLGDTVARYADVCQVRIIYLEQPPEQPYHLGIAVNAGIRAAHGEILTSMDGDMLVRPDFLTHLACAHSELGCVLNLERRRAAHAVGVTPDRWTEGVIDFERCLAASMEADKPIPETVKNKGPCISAPRAWWEAVGGYDEHDLWSTGISRAGQDVNARLEIYSSKPSRALPNQVAVHPWHPQGLDRRGHAENILFAAQKRLIDWSREHRDPTLAPRRALLEEVYAGCRGVLKEIQRA
jgi:hypothetical protein